MPYKVIIQPSARRDLDGLPSTVFVRLDPRILGLRDDPRPPGTVKVRGTRNGYRLRVGDYRILYEVNDQDRVVTIARVRHRREAYRDL